MSDSSTDWLLPAECQVFRSMHFFPPSQMVIYLNGRMTEMEAGREKEREPSTDSLSDGCNSQGWARPKGGS